MKLAVAYVRVSTLEQAEAGRGWALQEASIRAYAQHKGYKIIQVFKDAHTGVGENSFSQRPGASRAVAMSKAHRCPIIVDELSRFSRNLRGLKTLIAAGTIKLISAREDFGTSQAALVSATARAQCEAELISRSTKVALQERKARGVLLGNRKNLPEARAKARARVQERVEQQVHDLTPVIQELRQSGARTAGRIAEGLNRRGHRTSRQGMWTANNIRRLLTKIDKSKPEIQESSERDELGTEHYRDHELWGAF